MPQVPAKAGFTLIEISIVLVIIGLLTGGILAGKSLIQSAKIRAQLSQIEKFDQAAGTFLVKYGHLPGDLPSNIAIQNNFSDSGAGGTWPSGIGMVTDRDKAVPTLSILYAPTYFFFNLYEAGLIEQSLSPVPCVWNIGTQFPSSKIRSDNAGLIAVTHTNGELYYFLGINTGQSDCSLFTIGDYSTAGTLTPAEANAIDRKVDDGLPGTGQIWAASVAGQGQPIQGDTACNRCITTSSANSYNLTSAGINCRLMIGSSVGNQ